jgi:FkbM family methyltransferase
VEEIVQLIKKLLYRGQDQDRRVQSGVTSDHVRWAYRLFLDREPENEDVINGTALEYQTTQALRAHFMISPEFRAKNLDAIPFVEEPIFVIKELKNGLRVYVDLSDTVIGLHVVRDNFEKDELDFIVRNVRDGQNVIDLGANVGLHTIHMAASVGPKGRVFSFEPLPAIADILKKTIAENNFQDRVEIMPFAVGAVSGEVEILYSVNSLFSGGSYLVKEGTELPENHRVHRTPIVTLDELELPRPIHFIKMDIEGSEPLACKGAEKILHDDRPIVMSELSANRLRLVSKCTPTDFIQEMAAREYDCFLLVNGNLGPKISRLDDYGNAVFLTRDRVEKI